MHRSRGPVFPVFWQFLIFVCIFLYFEHGSCIFSTLSAFCLDVDGVEEKYNWVKPILGDPHKVRCDLCKSKPFSVASGGIADCKQHANGANHRKLMKNMSTQRTLRGCKGNIISVILLSYRTARPYRETFEGGLFLKNKGSGKMSSTMVGRRRKFCHFNPPKQRETQPKTI